MAIKIIAKNKRASYDYSLLEKYEAGMVLKGTEVKSIRSGKVNISEAYITLDENLDVWAYNIYIAHWEFGNVNNHEERRKRKLLLNAKEIEEIHHRFRAEKLAIIPTIIYFKNGRIKLEIALGKGKKLHDKRQDAAKKDIERKIRQGKYDD